MNYKKLFFSLIISFFLISSSAQAGFTGLSKNFFDDKDPSGGVFLSSFTSVVIGVSLILVVPSIPSFVIGSVFIVLGEDVLDGFFNLLPVEINHSEKLQIISLVNQSLKNLSKNNRGHLDAKIKMEDVIAVLERGDYSEREMSEFKNFFSKSKSIEL